MPKPGCKVFVGDLKPQTQERDVEEAFAKFGQLKNCFVAGAPGKRAKRLTGDCRGLCP